VKVNRIEQIANEHIPNSVALTIIQWTTHYLFDLIITFAYLHLIICKLRLIKMQNYKQFAIFFPYNY